MPSSVRLPPPNSFFRLFFCCCFFLILSTFFLFVAEDLALTAQRCYGIPSYWTDQAASASTDFVRTIFPLTRSQFFFTFEINLTMIITQLIKR